MENRYDVAPRPVWSYPARPGVECRLCAHVCRLQPGQTGRCRVRHNVDGQLLTSVYGRPVLLATEPIEKKYLFHVLPGAQTLSLGTPGCNMGCHYCVNWRVSQRDATTTDPFVSPQAVIDQALARQVTCIAFTYTEPTIFIEYALDIADLARAAGLAVVAKSNGLMAPQVLADLAPRLDAINIDLKGWQPASHGRVTGSSVAPVLANLRLARQLGLWLEVSTLLVPGLNDHPATCARWPLLLPTELGPETPWHLQRFLSQLLTAGPAGHTPTAAGAGGRTWPPGRPALYLH
jgi:pyruvate formate lyase activating enzyme